MSVSTMTNVAVHRRTDFQPLNEIPRPQRELAEAATNDQTPGTGFTDALAQIATYIPSEILTLYVAVKAALQGPAGQILAEDWWVFWGFLIGTPVVVWLVYAGKVVAGGKPTPWRFSQWPVWEMVAAVIAYCVWAFALPQSPFTTLAWYSAGLAAILVLVISMLLGLVAPIVQRPIEA